MTIHQVTDARDIPRKYQFLPIQPGPLEQCLDELKHGWPWFNVPEAWYCTVEKTLYVPARYEAK